MIPISGQNGVAAAQLAETTLERAGFTPYITLNIVDERVLEAVISVSFDREQPEQTRKAHQVIGELHAAFTSEGWFPYRVSIDAMHRVVDQDDPFWQTVKDLKQVLDPNHIISPGRYNLV